MCAIARPPAPSYYVTYPNIPVPAKFTVGINREAREREFDWARREIAVLAGPFVLASGRFRLIFGGRESILIAVYEIPFRPCSDADWSIGTRTGPRAPTGYQKNRKDLPACAPMEGAIFIRAPTLYSSSSSISRSLSFFFFHLSFLPPFFSFFPSPREHPSSSGFSRGVEEFFELTPTCSTTVRFALFRTKDPKWRLGA